MIRNVHRHVSTMSVLAGVLGLSAGGAQSAELTLSDFNGTGFTYTFDDFQQVTSADSVRLIDTINGWGGAGLVGALDLSAFGDGRLVVDVTANPANLVDQFTIELIDTHANTGKWNFSTSGLVAGQPTQMVSATTLNNPLDGINEFFNLDLSNIERWQLLGDFGSTRTVDLSFDHVAVSTTVPEPPAYPGAQPDAPWRAEAAAAIEQNRTSLLTVTVAADTGVVNGADVSVDMTEHAFRWGTAVQARRLAGNNPADATYQQVLQENFNTATIENALKWPAFEGEWGPAFNQATAVAALDWLNDRDFDVRGHVQVWPGYDNLPGAVKTRLDELNHPGTTNARQDAIRAELRTLITQHISELAQATAGRIAWWDMANETRVNRDLIETLGEAEVADWFVQGAAANPGVPLYLNEYNILASAGGINTSPQQIYAEQIQRVLDDGAPLGGIGLQSHFTEANLTGPAEIKAILDRFAAYGLPLHITEFDFATDNQDLQAQFTRDFMTIAFAHPQIEAFIGWGFWDNAHWRPNAGMFRDDWSIKPNGEAYRELVFDQWWTDEQTTTHLDGTATLRAFHGRHDVSVTHQGIIQQHHNVEVTNEDAQLLVQLVDGHAGTLDASVTNLTGRLRVAGENQTGSLILAGDYVQLANATLVMDIQSLASKDLIIADAITLDGSLEITTPPGFWPATGTQISLLSGAALSGEFTQITGDRLLLEGFSQGSVFGVRVLGLIGDFNLDGTLTADDIDLLTAGFGSASFDVTGDGLTDHTDLEHMILYLIATTWADTNLDQRVDLVDLSYLATNFGMPGGWSQGDFNADGIVDLIDLSRLASNFGFSTNIPEPAALTLLGLGLTLTKRQNA
ncbi:MAG: endo-1,4-beta-xylanase [Phycisphaeraceae bacterium]